MSISRRYNPIADHVANELFTMACDPNHRANVALRKHFEKQEQALKKLTPTMDSKQHKKFLEEMELI